MERYRDGGKTLWRQISGDATGRSRHQIRMAMASAKSPDGRLEWVRVRSENIDELSLSSCA